MPFFAVHPLNYPQILWIRYFSYSFSYNPLSDSRLIHAA